MLCDGRYEQQEMPDTVCRSGYRHKRQAYLFHTPQKALWVFALLFHEFFALQHGCTRQLHAPGSPVLK